MFKRIAAISGIFVCTAIAWAILGTTIFSRTYSAESGLSGRVASTWGAPQQQAPPAITREWQEVRTIEDEYDGKKRTRKETYQHSDPVRIDGSRITARPPPTGGVRLRGARPSCAGVRTSAPTIPGS